MRRTKLWLRNLPDPDPAPPDEVDEYIDRQKRLNNLVTFFAKRNSTGSNTTMRTTTGSNRISTGSSNRNKEQGSNQDRYHRPAKSNIIRIRKKF